MILFSQDKPIRIACVGDSITFGHGIASPKVFLSLPVPGFIDGDQIDRMRIKDGVIPIITEVASAKNLPVIDFYNPKNGSRKGK